MKKAILTLCIVALSLVSYSSMYLIGNLEPGQVKITLSNTTAQMNLAGFVKLEPKDYKKITGKKLSSREILTLKIKKRQRKDGTIASVSFEKKKIKIKNSIWADFFWAL